MSIFYDEIKQLVLEGLEAKQEALDCHCETHLISVANELSEKLRTHEWAGTEMLGKLLIVIFHDICQEKEEKIKALKKKSKTSQSNH